MYTYTCFGEIVIFIMNLKYKKVIAIVYSVRDVVHKPNNLYLS